MKKISLLVFLFLFISSLVHALETFEDGESNLSVRTKINTAIRAIDNQGVSLDEDYNCDIGTAIADMSTTPTRLICDCTVTLTDGDTDTLLSTVTWVPVQGCTVQGVSGGGIETIVINGPVDVHENLSWVGANLTVSGLYFASSGWFGSVGDGLSGSATTNTTAFQAAIDSLVDGGKFVIPEAESDYYFGTTGITFDVDEGIFEQIGPPLIFTGTSGVGVIIGDAGANLNYLNVTVGVIKNTLDWTETCSGIRLLGVKYSTLHLNIAENFTYGIEMGDAVPTALNEYYNHIFLGRITNNKIGLVFDGSTGSMNANNFYGGAFIDNNLGGANYSGSYGIYIPNKANATNGNVFTGPKFEATGATRQITNYIYCDGDRNTFLGPRPEGSTNDAPIRFGPNATSNVLIGMGASSQDQIYDETRNNVVHVSGLYQHDRLRIHTGPAYNTNFHHWSVGDQWPNTLYDEQSDSPGKICITEGTYWLAITSTATTTATSATVTVDTGITSHQVGSFINIVGVTGPLEVTARDVAGGEITIDPVADASVSTAAVSWAAPVFVDLTPASIRGYKSNWNTGSIGDGGSVETDITVTGTSLTDADMIIAGCNTDLTGLQLTASVAATDTVTLVISNSTGGAIDPGTIDIAVRVFKY